MHQLSLRWAIVAVGCSKLSPELWYWALPSWMLEIFNMKAIVLAEKEIGKSSCKLRWLGILLKQNPKLCSKCFSSLQIVQSLFRNLNLIFHTHKHGFSISFQVYTEQILEEKKIVKTNKRNNYTGKLNLWQIYIKFSLTKQSTFFTRRNLYWKISLAK